MKKMNNKGFAISSLLYALTIMVFLIIFALMSTMGSTRKNTRNLVDLIDDELNRYGLTNQTMIYDESIDNNTEGRKYFVNSNGWYQIELWGANYSGGHYYGGYASGIIYLEENQVLYIHLDKPQTQGDNTYINIDENDKDYTIMSISGGSTKKKKKTNYMMYGYAGSRAGGTNNTISHLEVNGPQPIFYNGLVVPETNTSNNSKFKITKISNNDANNNPLTRYNDGKLKNVKYIKDCVSGSDKNGYSAWQEIQAISNGENVVLKNNKVTVSPKENFHTDRIQNITNGVLEDENGSDLACTTESNYTTKYCATVELDKQYDLDEIAVWHYYDKRKYYNHELSVSSDDTTYTTLRNTEYTGNNNTDINTSEAEDVTGIRYSAFQPYTSVPSGTYYIFFIGQDDKSTVITPTDKPENGYYNVGLSRFTGEEKQKWAVSSSKMKNLGNNCYLTGGTPIGCSDNGINYIISNRNIYTTLGVRSNTLRLLTNNMRFANDAANQKRGEVERFRLVKTY